MALTILSSVLLLSLSIPSINSLIPESETLSRFKTSLLNTSALSNWNATIPPCSGIIANWVGLNCLPRGHVWGIQLEDMNLTGTIDMESLKELQFLRAISFMNNSFEGAFPNLKMLTSLRSVYLSFNKFSGEIPGDAFDDMLSLKKVYLSNNKFSGVVPLSLTKLPRLIELDLEGNHFSGQIPDFQLAKLNYTNLSNNNFSGQIPASLSTMNATSFSGNKELCGAPLEPCQSNDKSPKENDKSPPTENPHKQKPPIKIIVPVVVSIVVLLAATIIILIITIHRRRQLGNQHVPVSPQPQDKPITGNPAMVERGKRINEPSSSNKKGGEANTGKLTFIRNDREQFEMSDLLRASAEVLGSGYFGSSYKANMMNGQVVVVKRFRQMNNMEREEFVEHMTRIGRLSHPNMLPLVAFYFRKEEKLLVNDYVDNVSLAVHLHGNRNRGHPRLDWSTRLKIIKGVGKALVYLYNELPSLIVPHGHLKSSNVLLNKGTFEPLLTDYGLVPLVDLEHAQKILVAYKSPEYKNHSRVTKKTDVWSFGILILETLTGIFPANYLQQGKGNDTDLVTLVNSMLHEERKFELFDKDMEGTEKADGEITKMLKLALACVEIEVEKRLGLKEAVEKIEEIRDEDIKNEEF